MRAFWLCHFYFCVVLLNKIPVDLLFLQEQLVNHEDHQHHHHEEHQGNDHDDDDNPDHNDQSGR